MKLEKFKEVKVVDEYQAVMTFLDAIGIKTENLTIQEVSGLKYGLFSAIEFEDSSIKLINRSNY
jgi:hypothetical protein